MSAAFTRFSFNSCRLCDYTINKTDTWSLLPPPLPILLGVLAVDGQLGTGQRLQRGGIRAGSLCRERLSAKKL